MKIFGWMQNKLIGKPVMKNVPIAASHKGNSLRKEAIKEEFNDWPQGLLTIGTFGNNEQKEIEQIVQDIREGQDASSSPDLSDFTTEEIEKLQVELKKLLSSKSVSKANRNSTEITTALPLNKFLNCPSSLEIDRRIRSSLDLKYDEDQINKTISDIMGKYKEVSTANKRKDMGKKSIAFLLKKMFVCSGGFAPTPSLIRDTMPETRMEKLLRAMIYNKTNFPQPSTRPSSAAKYLENRRVRKSENDEDSGDEKVRADRSKWVKTDSEYIVLEI